MISSSEIGSDLALAGSGWGAVLASIGAGGFCSGISFLTAAAGVTAGFGCASFGWSGGVTVAADATGAAGWDGESPAFAEAGVVVGRGGSGLAGAGAGFGADFVSGTTAGLGSVLTSGLTGEAGADAAMGFAGVSVALLAGVVADADAPGAEDLVAGATAGPGAGVTGAVFAAGCGEVGAAVGADGAGAGLAEGLGCVAASNASPKLANPPPNADGIAALAGAVAAGSSGTAARLALAETFSASTGLDGGGATGLEVAGLVSGCWGLGRLDERFLAISLPHFGLWLWIFSRRLFPNASPRFLSAQIKTYRATKKFPPLRH